MKPTFFHRLINNPFEDPCLYVKLIREKRALMFDLGALTRLGIGDLLKITDAFVSHAHIDHFIGFDMLLRGLLRRQRPLRVFGPASIIACVEGKLKGYTWNLIKEYPLKLEVFGISEDSMAHASFYAEDSFRRLDRESLPFRGIVLQDELFCVKACILSHDIPCLGFSLDEDFHINIDKSALEEMGLPTGPWLGELKRAIRQGADDAIQFQINGGTYKFGELKALAIITKGQKLSYIVDASPTEDNLKKIIGLVKGTDTLYSEAYFLDADSQRATTRNHLTAKLAGWIAKEAGAKNLIVMHFSPKYKTSPDAPIEEAMKEFKGL